MKYLVTFLLSVVITCAFAQSITITTPISGDDYVNAGEVGSVTINGTSSGLILTTVTVEIGGVSDSDNITLDGDAWSVTLNLTPASDGLLAINAYYAGNPANTASNNGIEITKDVAAPTPSITSTLSPTTNNPLIPVLVDFGEEVTGFDQGDLSVGNGIISDFTDDGSGEFTFNVTASAEGDVTVDIGGGVATDLAGNSNLAATQLTVDHDITEPTPTISDGGLSDPTNSDPIAITIDFGEEVTGFVDTDIVVVNGSVSDFATSDNQEFTANINPAANGLVTVDIAADVATDLAGNNNLVATQYSITYDGSAPSGYGVSFDQDPITTSDETAVSFTISSAEVGTTYDYTITTDGGPSELTGSAAVTISPQPVGPFSITSLEEGNLTLTLTLTDDAGNTGADANDLVEYDGTNPVLTNVAAAPDSDTGVNITYQNSEIGTLYYAIFTADQGAPTAADIITPTGHTTSGTFSVSTSGMDVTENVTFAFTDAVTYYVYTVSEDGVGNTSSIQSDTWIADGVAPTGYSVAFDTDPIAIADEGAVSFSITSLETGTTFDYSITSTGGGTDVTGSGSVSTSPQTVGPFSVTGLNDGDLTLTLSQTDAAGNLGLDVTDDATYDGTGPIISIVSTTPISDTGVELTYQSDEAGTLYYAIFDNTQGSPTASDIISPTGELDAGTFTISTIDSDVTESITFAFTDTEDYFIYVVAEDAVDNTSNVPSDNWIADGTSPTPTITDGGLPDPNNANPIPISVDFGEPVTGFTSAEIIVTNGTKSNFINVDDTEYTIEIAPSSDGVVTINIAADVAADLAGNNNLIATEYSKTYDGTPPNILSVTTADTDVNGRIDQVTITFSEDINDGTLDNSDFDVVGYSGETITSGGANDDEITIDFDENPDPDTDATPDINVLAGVYQDLNGNGTLAETFSGTEDTSPPAVVAASTIDVDANGEIDGIIVILSENIDDSESNLGGSGTFDIAIGGDGANTGDDIDDNIVILTFNESGGGDTDATPDFTLKDDRLYDSNLNTIEDDQDFLGATTDGAPPILLFTSLTPDDGDDNVSINEARTLSFSFSEDITAISGTIGIYNSDDLLNPVIEADVNDPSIVVSGADVTWSQNTLLEKGETYSVGLTPGAFEDLVDIPSLELENTGENTWNWTMNNSARPIFVFSPQEDNEDVAPFGKIEFYFDEPVRLQNSDDKDLTLETLTGGLGSGGDATALMIDIDADTDFNDGGGENPLEIPESILPLHQYPPHSNPENFSKRKLFDVTKTSLGSFAPNTYYRITLEGASFETTPDDEDTYEVVFEFGTSGDVSRPDTTSLSPANNTTGVLITTTQLQATFDQDVMAGYGNISLFADLSTDLEVLNLSADDPLIDYTSNIVTIDISSLTLSGGVKYYVIVEDGAITDLTGNTFPGIEDPTRWSFTMETEEDPPVISSLTPADNSTNVNVGTQLSIQFNEPIQATAGGGDLTVRLSANGYIVYTVNSLDAANFEISGSTATITLPDDLGGVSNYYVNLQNGAVEDLGGTPYGGISGSFAWNFTTGADAADPEVVPGTFSPADGDIDVSLNPTISFYFDEIISPIAGFDATVSDGVTDYIFDVTDPEVVVSGNRVIITPPELEFNTEYYVEIEAGAFEDGSTNTNATIGGDGVWNFTTLADTFAPEIVSLTPSDNATGVGLSPTLAIEFTEDVFNNGGTGELYINYTDGTNAFTIPFSAFSFSTQSTPTVDLSALGTPIVLSGNTEYYLEIPDDAIVDSSPLAFAGIEGNGNWSFTTLDDNTDATPPTMSFSPSDGSSGQSVSTDLVITFDEPVTPSGTDNIIVNYTTGTGDLIAQTINATDGDASNGNTVYTYDITQLAGSTGYNIDILAGAFSDNQGNDSGPITGSSNWAFSTESNSVAPVVVGISPSNDATGISTTVGSLEITFNEPVQEGSGSVFIYYNDGLTEFEEITDAAIDATSFSDGNRTVSIPVGDLDGDTEYFVEVEPSLFEDYGNNDFAGIDNSGIWSFKTASDLVDPVVSIDGFTPTGGSVPVDPTLTINFSERVYAGTGTIVLSSASQNLSINVLDGSQISGFGTRQLTITPSTNLFNNELYTVEIEANEIEDASGNTFDGTGLGWTFTTGTATQVDEAANVVCTNGDYTDLFPIEISEFNNDDFLAGTGQTLIVTLPSQFEFESTVGSASATTGTNLSNVNLVVTEGTFILSYDVDDIDDQDIITISGLRVRYTGSTVPGPFNAFRTGGTANMKGNNVIHGQPHLTLTTQDPPAPPTLTEIMTNTIGVANGDDESDKAVYLSGVNNSNTPFQIILSGTGVSANVYTDLAETNQILTGLPNGDQPTLNELGLGSVPIGIYTFYVTQVDADGCESDASTYTVGIIEFTNSENNTTFSEDDDVIVTLSASQPNTIQYSGTWTGAGITNFAYDAGNELRTVEFRPTSAGDGSWPIVFTLTRTIGSVSHSIQYIENMTVNSSASVFENPEVQCYESYTEDLEIEDPNIAGYHLWDILAYPLVNGAYQAEQSNTIFTKPPLDPAPVGRALTGWEYDPTTVNAPQGYVITCLLYIRSDDGLSILFHSREDIVVNPLPTVSFVNMEDYYCEDDANVPIINVSVNSTTQAVDEYDLYSYDGFTYTFEETIVSSSLSPQTISSDHGVGQYQIRYTSDPGDDANGCTNSATADFEILGKPSVPTLTNDLSGIGSLNGSTYLLEFCEGDILPDLQAVGDSILWFDNSGNPITSENKTISAEDIFGTTVASGGLSRTLVMTNNTDVNIDLAGFEGCSSDPVTIIIRGYNVPSAPTLNLTSSSAGSGLAPEYLFEYCDGDSYENLVLNNTLDLIDPTESYFVIYDEFQNPIGTTQSLALDVTAPPFNLIGAIGETDFYISQTNKDNVFGGDAGAEFEGCNGPLTKITIDVNTIPDAPDPADFSQGSYAGLNQFYLCEGDELEDIQLPSPGDNSYYVWYEDDGTGTAASAVEITTSGDGEEVTQTNLEAAGVGTFDANIPGEYTYWVRRFTDENNNSGYIGCPSDAESITITVFPDPDSPTFPDPVGEAVNHISLTDANTHMQVAYCADEIGSVSFTVEGLPNSRFIWYESDVTGARGQEIRDLPGASGFATIPVNNLTSQLSGGDTPASSQTQYFIVSQVNNIDPNNTGNEGGPLWFEGCETEIVDMAFVELTIFPKPPVPIPLDGEAVTQDYYYCIQEVLTNGILMDTEQIGLSDIEYIWYDELGQVLTTGDSVSTEDIGLGTPIGNGFYTVFVSQTTHIGDSVALFPGCESDLREVRVYQQPETPTVDFSDRYNSNTGQFEFCEDDLTTSSVFLFVENVESNAVYNWYDENMNLVSSGASLSYNTNQNDVGTYTYFVSQTLYTNAFEGCESTLTQIDFEIFANPDEPAFPIIPGVIDFEGGDYTFLFCEGEVDPDFLLEIENVDPNVQYIWYEDETFESAFDTANAVRIGDIIELLNIEVDESGESEIYVRAEGLGLRNDESGGGCLNTEFLEVKINIGEPPVPAISWEGITEDLPTTFTFHEDNDFVNELAGDVSYTEYIINDESGVILETGFVNTFNSGIEYTFDNPGDYFITLIMRTSVACEVSVTRRVTILEQITLDPVAGYYEDFEGGRGGWFAEYRSNLGKDTLRSSSWEWGVPVANNDNNASQTPNDDKIIGAASGSNAWVTNLDGHYFGNEQSWVYSPSFDLTGLEIPIISFNHKHYFTDFRDGVVLQVSLDNGDTWRPLGEFSNLLGNTAEAVDLASGGLNWYTNSDVASEPGSRVVNSSQIEPFNQQSIGWSERQDKFEENVNDADPWLNSAHAFNVGTSGQRSAIRFRFALSSNTGEQVDNEEGFAFDDFRIYNGQKRVLLETFSSMITQESKEATVGYDTLSQQNSSTIWVNYFTGLVDRGDENDMLNARNINDPAARSGYYGVATVPNAVIEGEFQIPINSTAKLSFGARDLSKAALRDRGFDITGSASYSEGVISANATFEAVSSITGEDTELAIRFMIIEKVITITSENAGGVYQEGDVLRNVLRKVLPSVSGIIKKGPVSSGAEFVSSVSWKVENIYNPDAVSVIAFIQNENTKEVYQVAEFDLPSIPIGEISVGFDMATANYEIYPNPANDKVNLQFGQAHFNQMDWAIFDQTGRELKRGQIKPGTEALEISTENLPSGIYLIHIFNKDAEWRPRRLMVIHD